MSGRDLKQDELDLVRGGDETANEPCVSCHKWPRPLRLALIIAAAVLSWAAIILAVHTIVDCII